MKSARTLIAICLLLTAASLFAQTTPSQQLMTVNIPFAFGVEDQSLPAGQNWSLRLHRSVQSV